MNFFTKFQTIFLSQSQNQRSIVLNLTSDFLINFCITMCLALFPFITIFSICCRVCGSCNSSSSAFFEFSSSSFVEFVTGSGIGSGIAVVSEEFDLTVSGVGLEVELSVVITGIEVITAGGGMVVATCGDLAGVTPVMIPGALAASTGCSIVGFMIPGAPIAGIVKPGGGMEVNPDEGEDLFGVLMPTRGTVETASMAWIFAVAAAAATAAAVGIVLLVGAAVGCVTVFGGVMA